MSNPLSPADAKVTRDHIGAAAAGANADITSIRLNYGGLRIKDLDASNDFILILSSDITSDRTLTIVMGDADRTITLNGDVVLGVLTTKGDLLTRDATDDVRFPVGADGFVLTADSGEATGLKWAAASSGSPHDLLDGVVIQDSLAAAVSRGSLIVGNSTPKWAELNLGAAGTIPRSDGTDLLYSMASYPNTITENAILYASGTNVIGQITSVADSIFVTDAGGIPGFDVDIPTAVTIGTAYIYRAGGTDVPLTDGGTGASTALAGFNALSPLTTRGDLLTRDATNNVRLALGSAGKIPRSDGTDLVYSTATYPGTTTINRILYSSANDVIGQIASANSGVLVTGVTGIPSIATDIPTAVTIGGAYVYRAAGTNVAVADGGTNLDSGTDGGILGFTAAGTIASSALLTAKALVIGGGAGATPTTIAALTNGQLAIGSTGANPVPAALTGTAKEITVTGGAGSITLSSAATDGCRLTNTAVQTFTTGVLAAITFDTEQYDNGTTHDTGANTSRITFATAGIYSIVGNVDWVGNATGRRTLSIRLNGATLIAQTQIAGSTTVTQQQVAAIYKFAAADYVELCGTQNSGGNLNVSAAAAYSPMFAAHWISK